MTRRLKIHAERQPWNDAIAIKIGEEVGAGSFSVAKALTFEPVDRGQLIEPCLLLNMTASQLLMDELWYCGIRPTEGTGSAGSLAATERHLSDMRLIALGSLNLPVKSGGAS